jgi:hypothetical protein
VLPLTVGPLFSLWNEKAELDVGVQFIPVLQWHNYNCNADGEECGSKFDGDYLLFPWVAGSIRLGGHARIFGGFAHLATLGLDTWVCEERDPDGDACVRSGTMTARNIPTLFLGFRIHGREFAADIGLHAPLHPDWWEYTDWIIVPFATFGHLW